MEEKRIYKAISDIMTDIDCIGKEKTNQQQGFKFRGIDDVMNKLKPLLAKHGVFIVTEVLEHHREERTTARGGNLIYSVMKVKHHFTATDGSEVCTTTIGEGMDSADKSSNKAMAIAFKYACFQIFCIPTEEMAADDPDNTCHDTSVNNDIMESWHNAIAACTTREHLLDLYKANKGMIESNAQIKQMFSARKEQL